MKTYKFTISKSDGSTQVFEVSTDKPTDAFIQGWLKYFQTLCPNTKVTWEEQP